MGKTDVTGSGKICQEWISQWPHEHSHGDDAMFPDGRAAAARNFCRNPDNHIDGPWCYTIDPNQRYEFCNVALCTQ